MLAFAAVILVNTLAIVLPINGMDTGRISDRYPNLFVPAGFTFSIWSVIYLLLLLFCAYSLKTAFAKEIDTESTRALEKIAPLFFLSCLLNISWILLWHYLYIELSVVVMLLFLATLIRIFLQLVSYKNKLSALQGAFIRLPFSVYLGWISVATVANITAMLVHAGWDGFGIQEAWWSATMIFIAVILGNIFLYKWKDLGYGLVIGWALFGIYSKQMENSTVVGYAALVGLIVLAIGFAYSAIRTLKAKSPGH